MLNLDRLRQVLSYDAETGIFRWKWDPAKPARVNSRDCKRLSAGHPNRGGKGRRGIKIEGRTYFASRLAWFYVYGEWPTLHLDHINGDKDDNRISNLREATPTQNNWNVGITKRNKSGHKGVHWNKRYQKWQAEIRVDNHKIYLGRYDDLELAAAAYAAAVPINHGEFGRVA